MFSHTPFSCQIPVFQTLPLAVRWLEYIYPSVAAAHPFDNGTAAVLERSLTITAE
jgi:hypothetical protein